MSVCVPTMAHTDDDGEDRREHPVFIKVEQPAKARSQSCVKSALALQCVFMVTLAGCGFIYFYTYRDYRPTQIVDKAAGQPISVKDAPKSAARISKNINVPLIKANQVAEATDQKISLIGMRFDDKIQTCNDAQLTRTFPDLDYSLMGYNALTGFPLAEGHDPGFVHPIFYADYGMLRQTADCRYVVPEGLTVAPDISCVTSFTSKEVSSSAEYEQALSTQAHLDMSVNVFGFGVSFSANSEYKHTISALRSGESAYVFSSAFCNYYYSKLNDPLPPFSTNFLDRSRRLVNATEQDLAEFVDYYGTHYPTDVTYGAKFWNIHKMNKTNLETMRESGSKFSVSAKASFFSYFSLSGGYGMEQDQKQAAKDFSKNVEKRTVTVGAPPPANGDAMTWASEVKDSPIPIKYNMFPIYTLFTAANFAGHDIDHEKVASKLKKFIIEGNYCKTLLRKGVVSSCEDFTKNKITLKNIGFPGGLEITANNKDRCIETCTQRRNCFAITMGHQSGKCMLHSNINYRGFQKNNGADTIILPLILQKMKCDMKVHKATVTLAIPRDTSDKAHSVGACEKLCQKDLQCDAFVFCNPHIHGSSCQNNIKNCYLYSGQDITQLKEDKNSRTHFIHRVKDVLISVN